MTPRISTPDTDHIEPDPAFEYTEAPPRYATLTDLHRYRGDPVFHVQKGGFIDYELVSEGEYGFWDETWSYAHTGFASERLARLELLAYCEYELEGRPAWRVFLRYWRRRIATFLGLPVQYVNRFPTR